MIPKTIHYCWFGGNSLPEEAQMCIASWRKYCPQYTIKEWNESNFDLACCAYVKEAAAAKKWAFVSDYARFWILYRYGGLYFDTDVELIKPIDDLVEAGPFMGCEVPPLSDPYRASPAPGLGLAAPQGLAFYKEILCDYEQDHFIMQGGSCPATVVARTTKLLKAYGMQDKPVIQSVAGLLIYPPEYFCPLDFQTGVLNIQKDTRSIHHYASSWHTPLENKILKIHRRYVVQGKAGCPAEKLQTLPLRVANKLQTVGLAGAIRLSVKKLLHK